MKDVWVVETAMTNGVMVINSMFDVFTDEVIAREAAEKTKELNKDSALPVRVTVKKSKLFEPDDKLFS